MKKTLTHSNKLLMILFLVVSLFFVNTFSLLKSLTSKAVSSYYGLNTVEVKNGDFTDYTSNTQGLPYSIDTGWNGIERYNDTSKVNAGIIDVGENFYSEDSNKFGLTENPNTNSDISEADDNILMIKAISSEAKFGYVSEEITLDAGKYYVIQVSCKTGLLVENNEVINEAKASIYTSLSSSTTKNFLNIDTRGYWKTYKFFVATDSFDSSKFTIELMLGNKSTGSNGVTFFDNVEVFEVANIDYFSSLENDKNIKINLDNDYADANNFANANFEGDASNWVNDESNDGSKSFSGIYTSTVIEELIKENFEIDQTNTNITNNFVDGNSKQLFIANFEETKTAISSSETNFLNIEQFGLYHLSMLVKTGNLSGSGLSIRLVEYVENNDAPIEITQSDINSESNGLDAYNGYTKVEFYIRGNAFENKNVGIKFSLGTDTDVSGWAVIDNIVLQRINQTEYSKGSSTNILDLSKNLQDTTTILNGDFIFSENANSSITYPLQPANWTFSDKENNLSGIIRVNPTYFANDCSSFGLNVTQNPGYNSSYPGYQGVSIDPNKTKQNVLMVRNNTDEPLYFSSKSFTFSSSSSSSSNYYTITLGVKTLDNSKAFIKLIDSKNNTIAVINDISAPQWTTYTLVIRNGINAQELNLALGTNGNGENNYAFFDSITYSSSTSFDKESLKKNSVYVDLFEDSFYSHSNKQTETNVFETPNYSLQNYETSKESVLYNGIIKANEFSISTRDEANDKNILLIANKLESYQHIISNYTYKLSQNSYYEISVWVKTDVVEIVDTEFGAYFEIVQLDSDGNIVENEENKNIFKNIVASNVENNGWVKYSMYIYAENADQTIKVILGLGNEENLTRGKVYFDDLKVTDITKDTYTSQSENETTLISTVITSTTPNDGDESTSSSTSTPSDLNIWALFSSIILVVALVLAIAGYLIRRIPKKKIAKIKESNYSKAPTSVDEKEIKRNLKATREQNLEEIEKRIAELKNEKDALQKEYQELISKDENNSQKLYAGHTKKINKLNKEIEYLSSAVTFVSDEANIKIAEHKEIKKKKKEVEQEFLKMKEENSSNESNKENKK